VRFLIQGNAVIGIDRPSVHFYPEEYGVPAERGEWENGRMGDGTTPHPSPGKTDSSEGSEVLDGMMIKALLSMTVDLNAEKRR